MRGQYAGGVGSGVGCYLWPGEVGRGWAGRDVVLVVGGG